MTYRLPPLSGLRLFEAAARHQSFRKAAEELNLTPSAVSHGVLSLEAWLGVELFQRGASRGVSLTAAGRQYYPYVTEALSLISTGTQRLPGRRAERRVSVSVAPTFASRWLIPNLHRFRDLHPAISIVLDTSHRNSFFPTDGFDLAIRMGRGPWPGTTSELLVRERLLPVASAEYRRSLQKNGRFDWSRATLLRVTSVENDWQPWLDAVQEPVEWKPGLQFDTIHLAWEAAAQSLGVAMGRLPLIEADLDSGRLVAVATPALSIDTEYWIVSMPGEETRSDVRAFKRWIMAEMAACDRSIPSAQAV